nr:Ti-type conjugative transfer relaxase TraA [Methylobacterium sp.]
MEGRTLALLRNADAIYTGIVTRRRRSGPAGSIRPFRRCPGLCARLRLSLSALSGRAANRIPPEADRSRVAIYHLSVKAVSRAGGRSATAAAAYRSASLIQDERTGQTFDYQRRGGVEASFIVAPVGADWVQDRSVLWNAAEAAERRKDAKVAREIEVALPHELDAAQRLALTRDFAEGLVARYGIAADVALHAPSRDGDDQNWHAHILTTTRTVDANGLGAKVRVLDVPASARTEVEAIRELWQDTANAYLERAGQEVRIDRRSHLDRGLTLAPTEHVGVHATQMQRRDKPGVDRVAIDAEAAARNAVRIAQDPEEVLHILSNERAVFTKADIARTLHRYGVDEPAAFQNAMALVMACDALVGLARASDEGERTGPVERFTTQDLWLTETRMAACADRLAGERGYDVAPQKRHGVLAAHPELADEQRAAVEHVTGPERIASVVGLAGAGKSTMLGAAHEAWERQGFRVHGAALAGKAAEGLQDSAGIPSRTLASWQLGWTNGRHLLGKGDVLVIDEAGMVGSRQLGAVLDAVERAGAKVVLVGDPEQLQPIGSGAAFRAVIQRTGFVEIETIRRQHTPWQRAASVALGTRRTTQALETYFDYGAIHFTPDTAAARGRLVADYLFDRTINPQQTRVALAHTRADVRALNEDIRTHLQKAGELGGETGFVTALGVRAFAPGDRLVFLRNDRELGVKNGTLATVVASTEGRLSVRLDGASGRTVSVSQTDYDAVDHGYATTIHKSQGATVDRAFVLASGGMDRHLAYVALTRHRDGVGLYAGQDTFANFEVLAARLSRAGLKETVLDYVRVPVRDRAEPVRVPEPLEAPLVPSALQADRVAAAVPITSSASVWGPEDAALKPRSGPVSARPPLLAPILPGVDEEGDAFSYRVRRRAYEWLGMTHDRIVGYVGQMAKEPGVLLKGIENRMIGERALSETPAAFLERVGAYLDDPERYGGLRGKAGLFAFPAARAERAAALVAIPWVKSRIADLKSRFDEALGEESQHERARLAAMRIPIPGLSSGTRAALRLLDDAWGPKATLEALAALRAEPNGVAEVEAFRLAVEQRFGTGSDRPRNLETRIQGELTSRRAEIEILISGADYYGPALSREPEFQTRLDQARQEAIERALRPAPEPERAVEAEREPAQGLTLGLGF